MWKSLAYAIVAISLLAAVVATFTMDGGAGAPWARAAWSVFLVSSFVGYFAFWRGGPGPADHGSR